MERLAEGVARNLVLRHNSENAWFLVDPAARFRWYEVMATRGGRLLVDGDNPVVGFMGGPRDPMERVQWVAESHLDYLSDKARPVMGHASVDHCCEEVLMGDLCALREERELDEGASNAVRYAIGCLKDGWDPDQVVTELYGYIDAETQSCLGQVIAPKLYYAHAAVKRLYSLLKEAL